MRAITTDITITLLQTRKLRLHAGKSFLLSGCLRVLVLILLLHCHFSNVLAASSSRQVAPTTVSGKVTDENGDGLPGASVIVKGTKVGITTDTDGNFQLDLPDQAEILVISFIGYETKEINIQNRSVINISLTPNIMELEDVVVVGYGVQKKSDLTGSVASYQLKESDGRQFTSTANLLQGRMPGVVVSNNSFQPGAAASIKIRGTNSLRGDNEPLYVVDNVPLPSSALQEGDPFDGASWSQATAQSALASINPSDIERIEVLKDASATAIYGSRGANGVILITTKQGQAGKMKVNFETSFKLSSISRKIDLLDLKQYAAFRNELSGIGNEQFVARDTVAGLDGSGYVFIPSDVEFDPAVDSTYRVLSEVDWQDELFNPSVQNNTRISLTGGSKKLSYFIASGYQKVSGMTQGTGLEQGDFRVNLNGDLSKKLSMTLTLNGVKRDISQQQNADWVNNSIVRAALASKPYVFQGMNTNLEEGDELNEEGITSVYSWLEDYDDLGTEYNFTGSLDLKYQLFKGLSYELRTGGNYRWKERARWLGKKTNRGGLSNGALGISTLKVYSYTIENLLRYEKKFNHNFSLNAVLGITSNNQEGVNERINGVDFDIEDLRTDGIHLAKTTYVYTPVQNDYRILSYLGRVNFNLIDGKYLITTSLRADGSSKFPNDPWGYFPSGSVAWKINKESFMNDLDFLDLLKLRAGWGMTGNQSISPFSTIANYTGDYRYSDISDNSLLALVSESLANSDLTWETTTSTNLGLDFALLKARINGSVDVYNKKTDRLLNSKNLNNSSGFGSILVNQGSIENKGIEFDLAAVLVEKGDFSFSLGGNMSFNRTRILDLELEPGLFGSDTLTAFKGGLITQGTVLGVPGNIFIEGREPGLFWGYATDGILDAEDPDHQYTTGTNGPGEVRFVDQNGDGVIDALDETIIGNPNPKFTYGFYTDITYKSFSFRAFFNGVYDVDKINVGSRDLDYPGANNLSNVSAEAYENAWREENHSDSYVKIGAYAPQILTDRYIEDASYLRLAEVTLTYEVPRSWTNKLSMSGLNLYATANNLFTVTNYSGYDPAANSVAFNQLRQGIDFNSLPNARSYTLGLKATF